MRKVLFLDIDGVVLSGEEWYRMGNNRYYLPPEKIDMVRTACDRSGAVVVVSSTWRYSEETRSALINAGLVLHPDWRTPRAKLGDSGLLIAVTRGTEIAQWLAEHPEISTYAIVDDDSDMLPEQFSRFVHTSSQEGLQQSHVDRIVGILNNARPTPPPPIQSVDQNQGEGL